MAIRTKTSFESAYLSATGVYKDNIVGDISPGDLRNGLQDTWDSYTAQDTTMAANISTVSGVAADNTINIATNSGDIDAIEARNAVIDLSVFASVSGVTNVDFASGLAAPSYKEGRVFYDSANHTFGIYTDKSDVTLQLGQELHIRGINKTGDTIPNGTVVALTGAVGNRPTCEPAIASYDYPHISCIAGVTTHESLNNEEVLITTNGTVRMTTSSYAAGSGLYLSPTTSGAMTIDIPEAPNHVIQIGRSLNKTADGKVEINIIANPNVEDLSNVNGTVPQSGYILQYNSASGYWDASNALDPSGNIATSFFVASWAADSFTAKPKNVFGTIYSDAEFTGQTITSAQSRTITQGYNRHPVLNVTTLTTSGVVRISGNKINENTGVVTSGYTEDLTVTATGYYQGAGKYVDTITFGGTGDTTASVTATAYTTTYADFGNSHFGLKYVRFGWIPSNPTWDIALRVYKVNDDGSLTSLDQGRLAFNSTSNANRAANNVVGHAKIIQADDALIDVRGDSNEGIVIEITDKAGTGLPSNIASASFYIGLKKYNS